MGVNTCFKQRLTSVMRIWQSLPALPHGYSFVSSAVEHAPSLVAWPPQIDRRILFLKHLRGLRFSHHGCS
eukprot:scaffold242454_cov22-Tisochrysis_lutea.AAC.1